MAFHQLWEKVHRLVTDGEMPPAKEKTQPTAGERDLLLGCSPLSGYPS